MTFFCVFCGSFAVLIPYSCDIMTEEFWKRGLREVCYLYSDEHGTQYLMFLVLGNKRLRLSSFTSSSTHRLKYLKTLGGESYELGPYWKKLDIGDYLFGK